MAMIARALLRDFPERAGLFDIGELQLGSQIIRNHNGLLGRYPGADGMKTGFTCPAGFNVVATATHYGRRLITVVLGMPSAKLRNQEAADLFDRGFAMSGGSGSLDSLPSAGGGPPDMRANVCLHRSAAAIAAEEEGAEEQTSASSRGRGGGAIEAVAASGGPTRTVLSDERPRFDPVPVFIGPVAGWNGPVLGPRNTSAAAEAPSAAKAYAGDQPDAIENATSAAGEPNAPRALQGAVRTPPAEGKHHLKHHLKPVKHGATAKASAKAAKTAKTAQAAKADPATPPPRPPGNQ